jgi:tetratricopeptide (TPR) repeat protein
MDTKETKKQINLMKSTTPILDDDIIINKCSVDINAAEEDSYRFYISTLLLALSYAFLELRHFSAALESLTECISMSENFLSDSYFRRSQARFYNKKSKEKDLQLALTDIKKAISLNPDSKIYNTHLKTLLKTIERVREFEKLRINCKIYLILLFIN